MPSKRKNSTPDPPYRLSPRLHQQHLPPQDKTERPTRQNKTRFTKTESQSTLTQMNYVTTSSSSYEIEDNEDEEWEERPRKRRKSVRRLEEGERKVKRQSTLTQIDFTKLLTPVDLSENDVGENEEPCEGDYGCDQQHAAGHEVDEEVIMLRLPSVKSKGNVGKGEDPRPDVLKPIRIGILKTPKKFRGMEVVPSSQSPPDSPLFIQRKGNSEKPPAESPQAFISPIKFNLQRSPLCERPAV